MILIVQRTNLPPCFSYELLLTNNKKIQVRWSIPWFNVPVLLPLLLANDYLFVSHPFSVRLAYHHTDDRSDTSLTTHTGLIVAARDLALQRHRVFTACFTG
jgi:hypothetical protein